MQSTIEKTYTIENVMKRKAFDQELADKKGKKFLERKANRGSIRKNREYLPPQRFITNYKKTQASHKGFLKRNKEIQRSRLSPLSLNPFDQKADNSLLLVIRFRGVRPITTQIAKALKELRLGEILTGVFLKADKATYEKLKIVEPYILYGTPSKELVEELVYKRGHADLKGERKVLNNNQMIENALGDSDIICLEDLVHELLKPGKSFERVTRFIWPFKLNHIEELKVKGKLPFSAGGQWGDRGKGISEIAGKMI